MRKEIFETREKEAKRKGKGGEGRGGVGKERGSQVPSSISFLHSFFFFFAEAWVGASLILTGGI